MYYIVEQDFELDDDQHVDSHGWYITSTPAVGNMSREPVIDGWAGTTCGWIIHGHGEFETLDQARAAVMELTGEACREVDVDAWSMPDGTVEAYLDGMHEPLCSEATVDWAYEGVVDDVEADTTDEQIGKLIEEYEQEANSQGFSLDLGALEQCMREHRDSCQ